MMTLVDTIGAATAVIIFISLLYAYFYAFRPKNKKKFKNMENFVNRED